MNNDQPQPWGSLAGLNGTAERCTCSDAQLLSVGCDCPAEQNLPVQCECGAFLREQAEIEAGACTRCVEAGEPSLEERFEHYAFEERNGMPYGSSF